MTVMEKEYIATGPKSEKALVLLFLEFDLNFNKEYNIFTVRFEDWDTEADETGTSRKCEFENAIISKGLHVSFGDDF